MVNKESRAADITRKLFSVILVFTLSSLLNAVLIREFAANPGYWRSSVFNSDVTSLTLEDRNEIHTDRLLRSLEENGIALDGDRMNELIDHCYDEYFEVLEYKDTVIGEWFDEFFKGLDDDTRGNTRFEMENDLERFYDEVDRSNFYPVMDGINTISLIVIVVSLLLSAGMIIITAKLHLNKWLVGRSSGVSLAVAGAIGFILWRIVKIALADGLEKGINSSLEQALYDSIIGSLNSLIWICVAVHFAGVVTAVFCGVRSASRSADIEDGYYGEDE